MSNELTLSGCLTYEDSEGSLASLAIADFMDSVSSKQFVRSKQSIGYAAEEAIDLGDALDPGWAIFINRDATNSINLKVESGGAIFAKLKPNGGFAILYLGSGAQVPYAIAETAACQMEYLIANA